MHNDIKESIKIRLYDMKYTPFLASYTFFFIYFNAKLFLIFFDSELTTSLKIDMLSYDMIDKWIPLYWALAYVLVFSFFQLGFYSTKLWFDKNMDMIKQIKQKIEAQILYNGKRSKRYTAILARRDRMNLMNALINTNYQ